MTDLPRHSATVETPERVTELGPPQLEPEWHVIVFDNPINTFAEVIMILQKATGASLEEAEMETWEVHHLGRSIVHHGEREECERAAAIIRTIGIRVEVEPF